MIGLFAPSNSATAPTPLPSQVQDVRRHVGRPWFYRSHRPCGFASVQHRLQSRQRLRRLRLLDAVTGSTVHVGSPAKQVRSATQRAARTVRRPKAATSQGHRAALSVRSVPASMKLRPAAAESTVLFWLYQPRSTSRPKLEMSQLNTALTGRPTGRRRRVQLQDRFHDQDHRGQASLPNTKH